MDVEILGVDSGDDAEREANNEMCDIVLADTTQTTPLGSRTFRFLYATDVAAAQSGPRGTFIPGQAGPTSGRIVTTVSLRLDGNEKPSSDLDSQRPARELKPHSPGSLPGR